MKDLVLKEDLEFILDKVFKEGKFNRSTVLVTGATGLVGSLIVKSMLYANQILNAQITVLASVRNLEKATDTFADFLGESLIFVTDSLLSPLYFDQAIDFIVHTASITASKEMVENPTGVLLTAFESTKNLLEYVKAHPSCKMLYISSMEYYGQVTDDYTNVTEDKLGYVDLSKPRSCYPESNKTDIILHTMGQSEGNYCYTADAVYGIFVLLQKGEKGQSYNVARNHSTILNMAKMVADKISNNQIKVEVHIPENLGSLGYAPDVKLKLNSDKLKALGWQPEMDLENMFKRMIRSWELQE